MRKRPQRLGARPERSGDSGSLPGAALRAIGVHALDDRDELDEARTELVAEVAIHLERVVGVGRVHRAQHVEVDAVLLQRRAARITSSNVGRPPLVDAVRVVQRPRAVNAETDEEVVLARGTRTTASSSQRAVGLDRVLDRAARLTILLDVAPSTRRKKSSPMSVGSPPCQAIVDLRVRLGLEQLADVGLEDVVGHPEPAARIQHLLRQEEAVLAVEVADGAGRLGEHVKRRCSWGGHARLAENFPVQDRL